MPIRRLDKTLTATTATVAGEDIAANSIPVKPHIQYGVLQPAVAGKLLNGATHSGAYGTAQTQSGGDGHSYYYTDIKGSKPIKDPRIGAHFGSQRHKFKSLQLLEQETATHGEKVFSIDGREWARACGNNITAVYGVRGNCVTMAKTTTDTNFIEIVGYWNSVNVDRYTDTDNRYLRVSLNGGTVQETDYNPSAGSPLYGRYVDSGSITSVTFNSTPTLGINTIKIFNKVNDEYNIHSIELIAQDTSSTANKSKIQIPAQNVVSYGKKFSVSATAHHYDPFNGFTNGTTLHSAVVDTATSLGLDTAPGSSAKWAISGSNNIRPYNGGRVVKWIDSDGTIKTSVNMMPPNAQKGVGSGAHSEITTPSATNTAYLPAFSDDAIDHSLAEVAKTFHWREFGNGAANQGTGATYADASMLSATPDNITYVMDDGLTSLSAEGFKSHSYGLIRNDVSQELHITFIGTGITMDGYNNNAPLLRTMAQNLPYGTHILQIASNASNGNAGTMKIDGVTIKTFGGTAGDNNFDYGVYSEITFHQPKMPPIPEDACILADYMLMADFVPQTAAGAGTISKGVRSQSSTRDCFFKETDGDAFAITIEAGEHSFGMGVQLNGNADSDTTATIRIPSFGTNYVHRGYQSDTRVKLYLDTTDKDSAATKDNTASYGSYAHLTSSLELGVYKFGANAVSGQRGDTDGFDIVTPIHTSSHYQAFETPFLNELVGGDRNMEQNNLIVTPDGKSWDEVTRDTSYIGNIKVIVSTEETDPNHDWMFKYWNDWRGSFNSSTINCGNKDFAISYDRIICLVGGHYNFYLQLWINDGISSSDWTQIRINGERLVQTYLHDTTELKLVQCQATGHLQRGDYVQIFGASRKDDHEVNRFEIIKLEK